MGRSALHFGVVILAAGASSRMGKPKLLLPWGGTSVLGHLIGQWKVLRAGQIAAVFAAGDQAVSVPEIALSVMAQFVQRRAELQPQEKIACRIAAATALPG